jgi:hypothetical protein
MNKNTKFQIAVVFICFSMACFIAAYIFNQDKGAYDYTILPPYGGIVGPIELTRDKSVLLVDVKQDLSGDNKWSSIYCSLLDEKKEYLYGFGKDLYRESGRDYDGYWSEQVTKMQSKLTIPKKGIYFLQFEAERSSNVSTDIEVTVSQKVGSALPFFVLGLVSLGIGLIMYKMQ